MINIRSGGSITINGRTYSGNHIQINGDKVIVDGEVVEGVTDKQLIIQGDVVSVASESGNITVNGNISGNAKTMSGDVTCGNITGHVTTMSGDVSAREIGGSVSTMSGDIKR